MRWNDFLTIEVSGERIRPQAILWLRRWVCCSIQQSSRICPADLVNADGNWSSGLLDIRCLAVCDVDALIKAEEVWTQTNL